MGNVFVLAVALAIAAMPALSAERKEAELMAEIRAALEARDTDRAEALARKLSELQRRTQGEERAELETMRNSSAMEESRERFEQLRRAEEARTRSPEYRIGLAARDGDLVAVQALHRSGAKLNQYALDPAPPLFEAVLHGHREIVAWLLDHGAQLRVTGEVAALATLDALDMAVRTKRDNSEMIRYLVSRGADLDGSATTIASVAMEGKDRDGKGEKFRRGSPLLAAIGMRRYQHARTLLDLGASPDIFGSGSTPLMLAAGRADVEAVELLLVHSADVNLSFSGDTALARARRLRETEQNRTRRQRVIQLLRDAGASIVAAEPEEESAAPADFPIPSPAGGSLITDGWDGNRGHITLRYPADRHREILDYYDEYTDGAGWRRSEMGRGEPPAINYMNLLHGRNISVGPPEGDKIIVTLTVS